MRARLMALAAAIILTLLPIQASWASIVNTTIFVNLNEVELPAALADDDSFDDLPFEQLRQALREEVEYGPKKGINPRSLKKYNLLIRWNSTLAVFNIFGN